MNCPPYLIFFLHICVCSDGRVHLTPILSTSAGPVPEGCTLLPAWLTPTLTLQKPSRRWLCWWERSQFRQRWQEIFGSWMSAAWAGRRLVHFGDICCSYIETKKISGEKNCGGWWLPGRLFHIMLNKRPIMPFSNAAKCSLLCHWSSPKLLVIVVVCGDMGMRQSVSCAHGTVFLNSWRSPLIVPGSTTWVAATTSRRGRQTCLCLVGISNGSPSMIDMSWQAWWSSILVSVIYFLKSNLKFNCL